MSRMSRVAVGPALGESSPARTGARRPGGVGAARVAGPQHGLGRSALRFARHDGSGAAWTRPDLTSLQRTVGNRAARDIVRRQAGIRGVGAGRAPLEHQADRMASEVTGATREQSVPSSSRASVPSVSALSVSGGGLDASLRRSWGPRFGDDFADVAVHTGPSATRAARSLGARAFTYGNQIVFGRGQYRPETSSGQQLLAHELAHVVQQRGRSPFVQREPEPEPEGPRPELSSSFAGPFGPLVDVFRDVFLGEALKFDQELQLKGFEFTSLWPAVSAWIGPAFATDSPDVLHFFGADFFETFDALVKLGPSGATDFATAIMDGLSLIGQVRIVDYFGSDLFLEGRLLRWFSEDAQTIGMSALLLLLAQSVNTMAVVIHRGTRDEPDPDEYESPEWLAHLATLKFLADQALKNIPFLQTPSVTSDLSPLSSDTFKLSKIAHFADEGLPSGGKIEYSESASGGSKLDLATALTFSQWLGGVPDLSGKDALDPSKHRGGQLSFWGAYQQQEPTEKEQTEQAARPFQYAEGGILGGYGGFNAFVEFGRKWQEGETQSSFYRGGASYVGPSGGIFNRAGVTVSYLDWIAGAKESDLLGGEAGHAFRVSPFVSFGSTDVGDGLLLSASAAASLTWGSHIDGLDLEMLKLALSLEKRGADAEGKLIEKGLPLWSVAAALSLHRPEFFHDALPYLYGAQLKGNVGPFFLGSQFHIAADEIAPETARVLGVKQDELVMWQVLFNAGWNFDFHGDE